MKEVDILPTAKDLLEELASKKKEYLDLGKIRKKKDKLKYPINSPFVIPNSWKWAYLTEISIIQEGPGIRKHQYADEGMQFLTVTNILEGSVDFKKSQKYISSDEYNKKYQHFKISKGDIVTACSGASWGKSAMFNYDNEMILNTSTLRLRFFGDLGSNKYLYYLTKTDYFKKNLSSHSTGQQPNYGYSHYSQIPIPIPSLSEQKKIVTLLDAAFAKIDQAKANIEKNIENAKELFQSKLNEIFSQTGDGWVEKTLGEVCEVKGGKRLPKGEKLLTRNTGYPYIRARDLKKGTVLVDQLLYLDSRTQSKIKKYIVKDGDIYITIVGAKIGDVGIIPKKLDGANLTENAAKIVLRDNLINKFLLLWLKSSRCQNNIKKSTLASAQGKLALKRIKNLPIFIVPIESQKQIILSMEKLLTKTRNVQLHYEQKLQNLQGLKKSLLQKAFAGELT